MSREKGWKVPDFEFNELVYLGRNVRIEYNSKEYLIQTDKDPKYIYILKLNDGFDGLIGAEIIAKIKQEDFYSSEIFGKPIREIIDDSYIIECS